MNLNVFSSLEKSGRGSVENYLTEAFVFVVRLLLQHEPSAGLAIINSLCANSQGWSFLHAKQIEIQTQISIEEGRPDIEIREGSESLVYVEVKHDSPLGVDQLERYKARLDVSNVSKTLLVLLTRSRHSFSRTSLQPGEFRHVCWYQVYNWLASSVIGDRACQYMVKSLMEFLEEKRMSMKRVAWEYIDGIPAFLNLVAMMEAAITEVLPKVRFRRTAGWNWRGYYLDKDFWWGIRYDRPLYTVYENNKGNDPVTFRRELDLEAEHFFSLDKDEQFECLVSFLQSARAGAVEAQLD